MMRSLLDWRHDKYGLKTVFHSVMGFVILLAGGMLSSLPVDYFYRITKLEPSLLTSIIRPALEIAVLSLLVCLYIRKVLKSSLREFRVCKPKSIILWSICAIALPLAVSGFFILLAPGEFLTSDLAASRKTMIILRAVLRSCLVAGITEELLFRGLIMHIMEVKWGKAIAVIVPSVLFGLVHILNIDSRNVADILLLILAGTAVGIMFSLIAVQGGSIWASAIVHGIWNLIIIGGILQISADPLPAIFTYQLTPVSVFLTGGAFGIEASLPAITSYGLVICLAYGMMKKRR
jgi:membrane protease YdiL (CAAX protease family)